MCISFTKNPSHLNPSHLNPSHLNHSRLIFYKEGVSSMGLCRGETEAELLSAFGHPEVP